MLKSIDRMFKSLDEAGVVYCHWKSNEHLEEALDGKTDLDMLFDPSQRVEVEKVLDLCGLKRFRSTPLMQYSAIEDFIGFDQTEARIWHVHTHYRMTLGEKHLKGYTITPWGALLLNDRVRGICNVWTADPAEELVLLFCRISLKLRWRDITKRVSQDDQKELLWLKNRVGEEQIELVADRMLGKRSKEILIRLYATDIKRRKQFRKLQHALRQDLKLYTSYGRVSSWFVRTCREFFWLIGGIKRRLGWNNYTASRRVSPIGGLVVAILGCDGAGKSTTLSYITKEFNKKIDVASIYFGSGDGSSSLIRKPMKIIAKKVGGKGLGRSVEKAYEENKKISLKSRLYSIAKVIWAISLAKEKQAKYMKMIKAKNNGLLVLTDRYPQAVAPGSSDGPLLSKYRSKRGVLKKIAEWEYGIYDSFRVNPPDLSLKLIVPTKIAIERKPEMTEEEIEKKKRIIQAMMISNKSAEIDTSRPFEITVGEVMREIWNLI